MLKYIFTPIFLLACSSVAHADWVKINSPDRSANLYLDKSVAEKSGSNMIKLWHIIDYETTQEYEGKAYRSIKANYEYDCDHMRYRGLILLLHSEPMGNGVTVFWTHGFDMALIKMKNKVKTRALITASIPGASEESALN